MKPRVLFIVRYRQDSAGRYAYDGTYNCFGGLYYSALFVAQMLVDAGITTKIVQACDNNDIDREVTAFRPTHVIIEALWVVPGKFTVLHRLHPSVKWIVRVHSEIPFLAYDGVAMEWLCAYVKLPNVAIASNSPYGVRDFDTMIHNAHLSWTKAQLEAKVLYLPNFYPAAPASSAENDGASVEVGCFGALRPLKNQLIQALAAIEYARWLKKPLRFHINTRCEQGGEAVLANLRALFKATHQTLVEHQWETHQDFLETLAGIDVGMQVSFSETFDITAADIVSLNKPLVTSQEVAWSAPACQAQPTNTASIVAKLRAVTGVLGSAIRRHNLNRLRSYCAQSRAAWIAFVEVATSSAAGTFL